MTTLYYAPGACSLAPHIVLEWIGAPYEARRVDIGSDELRALNPAGAVPVLREDDGWVLTQCAAILEYLAAKYPDAGLAGGNSLRDRAEAHKWAAFFTSDVHAAFWPIFLPQRYTTQDTKTARNDAIAAGKKLVEKQFGFLNDHLDGRDWMLGEGKGKRSIIDAYAFPMIRWAVKVLPDGISAYPNVKALHDRMAADPTVQKVLDAEQAG